MKHLISIKSIALWLFVGLSLPAWSATDMFIKIGDIKGESKLVACPGGVCELGDLAAGEYKLQVTDEKGTALDKRVVLHQLAAPSTREAGSGLATGKRQHKPLRMTNTSADALREFSLKLDADETAVTVQIKDISALRNDKADKAVDAINHNSTRSNKTSN